LEPAEQTIILRLITQHLHHNSCWAVAGQLAESPERVGSVLGSVAPDGDLTKCAADIFHKGIESKARDQLALPATISKQPTT